MRDKVRVPHPGHSTMPNDEVDKDNVAQLDTSVMHFMHFMRFETPTAAERQAKIATPNLGRRILGSGLQN